MRSAPYGWEGASRYDGSCVSRSRCSTTAALCAMAVKKAAPGLVEESASALIAFFTSADT